MSATFETFIVLEGKLEFSLNDDGGQKIVLSKWDTFSWNDKGLPPAMARQIEAIDPNALEVFKTKMGLRFDAGPEV